jgi:hypothetical protein
MPAIILAAIITIAIIALFFVVNARLNRRNPELEDYPRKPEGFDDIWVDGRRRVHLAHPLADSVGRLVRSAV